MNEIASLEFLSDGRIKSYFTKSSPRDLVEFNDVQFDDDIRKIREYARKSSEKIYHKEVDEEKAIWLGRDEIQVPVAIAHNLESIANQIKNIVN